MCRLKYLYARNPYEVVSKGDCCWVSTFPFFIRGRFLRSTEHYPAHVVFGELKKSEMKSGIKILLVEDDLAYAYLHKMNLARYFAGYNLQLTEAGNGKEALTRLTTGQELPDIILLDLYMPVMTGFELLEKLVDVPHIKCKTDIYMLSSLIPEHIRAGITELGLVKDFFEKPLMDFHVKKIITEYNIRNTGTHVQ